MSAKCTEIACFPTCSVINHEPGDTRIPCIASARLSPFFWAIVRASFATRRAAFGFLTWNPTVPRILWQVLVKAKYHWIWCSSAETTARQWGSAAIVRSPWKLRRGLSKWLTSRPQQPACPAYLQLPEPVQWSCPTSQSPHWCPGTPIPMAFLSAATVAYPQVLGFHVGLRHSKEELPENRNSKHPGTQLCTESIQILDH